MGRVNGKVAFITGAGRGQGRSHAVRLAEEGANVIVTDICAPIESLKYGLSSEEDLAETVRLVEATGQRAVSVKADVRDRKQLENAVAIGLKEFGKLDIVVANAGISFISSWDNVTEEMWDTTMDVNLKGIWNTAMATAPHLIENGGGSMIFTSSSAGIRAIPFILPYVASKHGVEGLVKAFAYELGDSFVRVNGVIPTGVDTPMGGGQGGADAYARLLEKQPRLGGGFHNILPIEITQPIDVSNAVLYLASDEARYVTASSLAVNAGYTEY